MNCRILFAPLVGVLFSAASLISAQPLADRVPADALLYVGWAGADEMGPGYEGSHLKAMVEASEIPRVVNDVLPKIMERIVEKEPGAKEPAAILRDVMTPMWRHKTALYIGPVDLTGPGEPKPSIAVLCNAGNDAPALERSLKSLIRQSKGHVEMSVSNRDGLVAFKIGEVGPLDGAKALAGSKTFTAAMSAQKSPVLAGYADVESLVKLIDQAVAKGDDANAKEKWPAARDALGLTGVKRISFVQGFDGKDWATHAIVEAPAPRKGIATWLEAPPVSDAALKAIPVTATVAGVGRLDLAKLFDGIRDAVKQLDENDVREFDNGIAQLNDMLKLDIRKDFLGSLGDEWSYYIAPEFTGRGPLGVVIVNRLKEANRAQEVFDKLKDVANAIIAGQAEKDVHIEFKKGQINGVTVHYLATPFLTPSWVIQNGNLYLGFYPQVVADAAGHVSREGKSILDNPSFIALRKRLGDQKAVSLQFYDLPRSAPTSYQAWMLVSSLAKFGDIFGVDTPVAMFPTLSTLLEHVSPAGSVSWVDESGWHLHAVTPFPGSTVLASDAAGLMDVQTNALLISIMLPSMNRARDQANRVKSASNLRQIGLACFIYATEHKGKFPDELSDTLQSLSPEIYANPRTNTSVPHGLKSDDLKRWINESSDYHYVGNGKKTTARADEVLAYERPGSVTEGVNILFADGHVEFLLMPAATQIIEKARKPRQLP